MRKKFQSGTESKYITKKKKEPSKFITKKKKKIDIGKIAADAMKKGGTKYITRKKKKFDLADLPSLQKKKTSKFITKKSPEEIREREMMRSKKMGGGMMGRRFGMKKGSFPDLSGDGKTTMKDILIGRGVIKKKKK
tara:strand:- start:93 stop:500 length:408 start_codon:yes stop_codon:yes gene_type:complete